MRHTPPAPPLLLVATTTDSALVGWLLRAAHIPPDRLEVQAAGGLIQMGVLASETSRTSRPCLALLDADPNTHHLRDAQNQTPHPFGPLNVRAFYAVPSVEAWAFADDRALLDQLPPPHTRPDDLNTLLHTTPDSLPNPKAALLKLFKKRSLPALLPSLAFLSHIDIGYACSRSPSLKAFLSGVVDMLNLDAPNITRASERHLSRTILANLVREVSPSDAVLWRTSDGSTYTAQALVQHIEGGSEVGEQYASDLLRVSRDLLRRAANRTPPAPQEAKP